MEGNCVGIKILWEEQGLQLRESGNRPQAEGGMASDSGAFSFLGLYRAQLGPTGGNEGGSQRDGDL